MKLTRQQIEQLIKGTHLSFDGKDLYGICPQCNHSEFGISLTRENNPFNCFRKSKCGFEGNIYTLLKFLGRTREFIAISRPLQQQLSSFEKDKTEEVVIENLSEIKPPFGWKRVQDHLYLRQRGWSDLQFKKFQVGECRFKRGYVTILVEMNKRLVAYISRSIKSKQQIDEINSSGRKYLRYENSPTDFSKILFGYDEITDTTTDIILVEGVFSKTKTDDNLGLDRSEWLKCCATFGAKVSSYQIQLLKNKGIKTIWLWFEGDVMKKIRKIANQLSMDFEVRIGYFKDKDPGDIDEQQAFRILENWTSPVNTIDMI